MIASWKRMIGWTGDSGDSDACVQGSLKFALSRDKFSYAVAGAERSITSADIPETFLGKPVSSIGDRAFLCCPKLASISIPSSVSSIGENAFNGCSALASVSIPSSVVSIGSYAFCGCSKLASISIPSSVSSIGGGAFRDCSSLLSIFVDAMSANFSSVDGVLLSKDGTTVVAFPGGRAGTYAIPSSVVSIGCGAFEGCSKLTSVAIPGSVRAIGSFAFFWCSSLSSVSFGGTVAQCAAAIDKGAICRFNEFRTVECSDGTHYIEIGFL